MTFQDDYDKKVRRLLGVTDDTTKIVVDEFTRYGGYCDTCSYEENIYKVVILTEAGDFVVSNEFYGLSDMLGQLLELEDDEI